jgi:hypothetical protein
MVAFIDTLYTHATQDYKQYSAIADLHNLQFTVTHTLGFSVFISHILATDLLQSHSHFKSHMKSSLHHLIHFLPLFCNYKLNSIPSSSPGRLASQIRLYSLPYHSMLPYNLYNDFARTMKKTQPLSLIRSIC